MKIYWSPDFKVRTLIPQTSDADGVTSPVSGTTTLKVPEKAIGIRIAGSSGATLTFSKTEEGAPAFENGSFACGSNDFEMPLQEITYVRISGSASFVFLVVPTIPGELELPEEEEQEQ